MTKRIAQKGYDALREMIGQIDREISTASKTSTLFSLFKIGRSTFKVSKTLERLKKFRETVIKTRTAFSDATLQPQKENAMTAQPQNPALDRALAVLRTSLGIAQHAAQAQPAPVEAAPSPAPAPAKRATKAVAQAQKPRNTKPSAPQHDVWFYFGQQKARAERRAS